MINYIYIYTYIYTCTSTHTWIGLHTNICISTHILHIKKDNNNNNKIKNTYSIYIHKLTLPALHDYLQNINNNSLIIIHIC